MSSIEMKNNLITKRRENIAKYSNDYVLDDLSKIISSYDYYIFKDKPYTIKGHYDSVTCIIVSVDKIITGSRDNTIKIWNVTNGSCECTLIGHSDMVECLAFISDSEIISASRDNTIKIWDLKTGKCNTTLTEHSSSVYSITIAPDKRIISGSGDKSIKIWQYFHNNNTYKCDFTLTGHTGGVSCVVFSPDGKNS